MRKLTSITATGAALMVLLVALASGCGGGYGGNGGGNNVMYHPTPMPTRSH